MGGQEDKTGNDEVMFRVSTDAGKTFGYKINLSNSPNVLPLSVLTLMTGTSLV